MSICEGGILPARFHVKIPNLSLPVVTNDALFDWSNSQTVFCTPHSGYTKFIPKIIRIVSFFCESENVFCQYRCTPVTMIENAFVQPLPALTFVFESVPV